MSTDFSSLPVVDLAALSLSAPPQEVNRVSQELHRVFSTTGFAYLINAPLSMSHDEVFGLTRDFFEIPEEEKMKMAKKTFRRANSNTYRGYFPLQPGHQDNLKEGYEIGPAQKSNETRPLQTKGTRFHLSEPNVWPSAAVFPSARRAKLERLHAELQALSIRLLELLSSALGAEGSPFASWLDHSVSTLRLLHYPTQPVEPRQTPHDADGDAGGLDRDDVKLCCTPHTDSGILTLLHQDPTGGLEVRNAAGAWVPAPYVPGSIVVNIGDLMARVSGGRYVATFHRVRRARASPGAGAGRGGGLGRLSVPFFFEPGEDCVVRSVDGGDHEGVVYGDHVREKMSTWVEFQDVGNGIDE